MSDIYKDGEPAFPFSYMVTDPNYPPEPMTHTGMSLRDWFAGQALCSIPIRSWAHVGGDEQIIKAWAKAAWAVADEMLAQRIPQETARD